MRTHRTLALVLAVGVALAGCGTTTVTEHSRVLALRVSEFSISPESVQIRAGVIRLEVRDDGVLAHQIALSGPSGSGFYEQSNTVFPGHEWLSRPFAIAPGRYRVFDPGANYADLGAYGTLTVLPR